MSQRILVTGGGGFIGSHFVDACLAKGYEVLVYDNFSVGKREFLPKDNGLLTVKEGDILDDKILADSLKTFSPEYVVHLAAIHYIPYCNEHPLEAIDVNIKGTHQVLYTVSESGLDIKKVIIASSAAVYAPSTSLHAEESSLGPTDIYGLTKYTNEMQAEAFHLQTGIDTVSARLFNAYGTRETNPHLIPEIIEQIKQGNTQIELGNITTKRSYVCVKDIAKALLGLLESDKVSKHEVCNIGSHHEYNAEELVNMLSEITGHPIECMSVKERQRASDRPRLQPALEKLENLTDWHEEYDMKIGLSEIVSEEL